MANMPLSTQQILEKLVSFDTTSRDSNLALIDWVQDYLGVYGVASTLLHNTAENKANLHAMIGPEDKAGIVLSGHTDVVPVDGQDWDSDPFALREHNGLLYGRGACDMKGFVACALAQVPDMVSAPLQKPIHFALSYDEEVGCLGALDLSDHIAGLPVKPDMCIIGEPSGMKPMTGHKGICDLSCDVQGLEMHSSRAPDAVNAVEAAAELVTYIQSIARRMRDEGPYNNNYDPPFTTLHVGVLSGGTATNIVPHRCRIQFEIRNIPEVDPQPLIDEIRDYAFRQIEPHMKDIDPKTGFQFSLDAKVPFFDIDENADAVNVVRQLTGANDTSKTSFATEAGIFHGKGIPTVVCGPGDIAQAHKPNEFVSIEQLTLCDRFLGRIVSYAQQA